MRSIQVIGPTRAEVDGVELPLRAMERALLAALAVDHPRAVDRDLLVARLWPTSPPSTARKSLQNHVARIRKTLGSDTIRTTADGYVLGPDTELDIPFDKGSTGHPAAGVPFADLSGAAPGVDGARRHAIAARTTARLAIAESIAPDQRTEMLELTVEEDPYAETAWIRLAEVYRETNRRRDAAQTFARARRTLSGGGLPSSDQLADAERRLLANNRSIAGPSPGVDQRTIAPSQTATCDQVVAAFDTHTSAVVLHGPAGIGKTTIIDLAALQLAARDTRVVATHCEPHPILPLEPIVSIVEQLLEREPTVIDHLRDPAALAILSPAVAAALGGTKALVDPERRRLESAVVELIGHEMFEPMVIVIDDLHWSTASVRAMLGGSLDAAGRPGRLGLLATWLGTRPTLRLGDAPLQHLAIEGLAADEVEAAVAPLVDDADLLHQFATQLFDATGGNPLFVREMARSLAADGAVTSESLERADAMPPTVSALLDARVAALSAAATDTVNAAAVLGRRQRLEDLTSMAPDGDIDAAVEAGILRRLDEHTAEFDHDLLRVAVLDTLGAARRIELHDHASRAIERSSSSGTRVVELAHHAVEAGPLDPLGAAHYAQLAAEIHADAANYDAAADVLRRAADALDAVDQWPRRRIELRIRQGAAELRSGDVNARSTLETAVADASTIDDVNLHAEATIELCRLGPTSEAGVVDEAARAAIEHALDAVTDPGLRARVGGAATMVYSMAGNPDHCRTLLTGALRDARADGRPEILGFVMPFSYMTLGRPDDLTERDTIAEQLGEIGRSLRRPDIEWEAAQIHFSNALQRGDPSVRLELARLEQLAEMIRERTRDWEMCYLRAAVQQLDGDLDASEATITASLDFTDSVATSRVFAAYGLQILALRLVAGRLGEMLDAVDTLVVEQPAIGAWAAAQAATTIAADRPDESRAAFDRATADDLARLDRDFSYSAALFCLGRAAADLNDAERAAVILPHIEPLAYRWSWGGTTTLGPMGEVVADCLDTAGRHDEARSIRTVTVSVANTLGAPLYADRLGSAS